jgi:hypothetical protein
MPPITHPGRLLGWELAAHGLSGNRLGSTLACPPTASRTSALYHYGYGAAPWPLSQRQPAVLLDRQSQVLPPGAGGG